MCANKTIAAEIGIRQVVEQMLSISESHSIIDNFDYKGFKIIIAKSDVTNKESIVLPKILQEREKLSRYEAAELKLLVRLAQDKKSNLFIAYIQLGSTGAFKKIQKIPLEKIETEKGK